MLNHAILFLIAIFSHFDTLPAWVILLQVANSLKKAIFVTHSPAFLPHSKSNFQAISFVSFTSLSLSLSQVVLLCWTHGLYDAMIYVYNRGMEDFTTPLRELFLLLRSAIRVHTKVGFTRSILLKCAIELLQLTIFE